jgi:hypothetical protein
LPDDVPIEGTLRIGKAFHVNWWGVTPQWTPPSTPNGAGHHVPIIEKREDWKRLRHPVVEHDEEESRRRLDMAEELLGDLLAVRLSGYTGISFHLMHWYCDYRGLENLFSDMIDDPEMVHDVMRFFCDGVEALLRQYEALGLFSLNNDDSWHYTGGVGYNNLELPAAGFDPRRVRRGDLWAAAESQELSCVSPDMHEEFALRYERRLLAPFGLNGYGCCDDLGKKLDSVLKIANLRRVAICPWADIDDFRPRLGDKYLMTWKPQPAHLAHEHMDEALIARELSSGIRKARGGKLELVLRDTHTCRNQPERFTRWIALARQAIEENWY